MADYDVIVIGAGIGGLCAGSLLAKQGRTVLVLEQSNSIGGCCSTFEKEGFHFDLGASVVEEIQPLEMAFEMLGSTFQKEVDLVSCDPMMSYISRDGSRITYPISVEETGRIISEISPEDGRSWYRFSDHFRGLTETIMKGFFVSPADTMVDMARIMIKMPEIVKYLPLFIKSYQDIIKSFFKNERILETMAYQSLYVGLPPELVPGLFAVIPYSEHEGIWYPRGGMIQIPLAFQRVGERLGMEIQFGRRVVRVMVCGRQAHGVVLDDGTEISASVVISDINAKTLYLDMIDEDQLPWLARWGMQSYEYSKSVPMLYLGLDYEPPLEAHHSVVTRSMEEIDDYWWNIVEKGRMLDEMFGLICWPTHEDPSLAPEGHHVLNLIPEGSYYLSGTNWDAEKEPFIERTIEYLSSFAIPGLKDHVKVADCSTPLDFERRLLMPRGAIYDLQIDVTSETVLRPSARSKSIKHLYLAGNSVHPGQGVPLVTASGIITANLIEKYE
jgi:phytoene desaturase